MLYLKSAVPALLLFCYGGAHTRPDSMVLHVRAATGVFVKPGSTPSVSLPPLQLPGSPVRKPRRPNKQRFDMLTKYVAGSCAYDLVDELLHAVLIEQPASVLPFLVTYLRKRAAVGKKDPALLGASESSKLEAAPALGAV